MSQQMVHIGPHKISITDVFWLSELSCMYTFTLEWAMKAQRGSRCIGLLFFNPSTRWGQVVNPMPHLLYLCERDLVPII
jgi:hypothetical protein